MMILDSDLLFWATLYITLSGKMVILLLKVFDLIFHGKRRLRKTSINCKYLFRIVSPALLYFITRMPMSLGYFCSDSVSLRFQPVVLKSAHSNNRR